MQTWTGCYITSPLKKSLDKTKQSKGKYRLDFIKYELDTRINIFVSVLCYELFAAEKHKTIEIQEKTSV